MLIVSVVVKIISVITVDGTSTGVVLLDVCVRCHLDLVVEICDLKVAERELVVVIGFVD